MPSTYESKMQGLENDLKAAEQKYDLENAGLIRGPYISLIFDSVRLLIDTGKEINELKKELGKQVNHSHNRRV